MQIESDVEGLLSHYVEWGVYMHLSQQVGVGSAVWSQAETTV